MKRYIKSSKAIPVDKFDKDDFPYTKKEIQKFFEFILDEPIKLSEIKWKSWNNGTNYNTKMREFERGYQYIIPDINVSIDDLESRYEDLKAELTSNIVQFDINSYEYSPNITLFATVEVAIRPKDSWKSFVGQLEQEAENGVDSLYELTDVGNKLQLIQQDVEDKMGIWLEPSVQAGTGGIWVYSKEDDSTLASNYDYQTFNEDTVGIAINSKNEAEYRKAYKQYLQNILK